MAGFYLGFRVWEGSCTSIVKGDLGACPSRKVWDFRSSEVDFDAMLKVNVGMSHKEFG